MKQVLITLAICAVSLMGEAQDTIFLKNDKIVIGEFVRIDRYGTFYMDIPGNTHQKLVYQKKVIRTSFKYSKPKMAQRTAAYSGKLDSYTAKNNGYTYHVGDTLWLASGSGQNGMFVYFKLGGMYQTMNALSSRPDYSRDGDKLYSEQANTWMIIKKMKMQRYGKVGNQKMTFVLGGGNLTNYWCFIELALNACEVKDGICPDNQSGNTIIEAKPDSYLDELLKLANLLEIGAITQDEFNIKKAQLLKIDRT